MPATLCTNALPMNARRPTGLAQRLHTLWQQIQLATLRQRQADALRDLSGKALCDINAPEWLRRDVLHQAEMEHYDRMRTVAQFRGFM